MLNLFIWLGLTAGIVVISDNYAVVIGGPILLSVVIFVVSLTHKTKSRSKHFETFQTGNTQTSLNIKGIPGQGISVDTKNKRLLFVTGKRGKKATRIIKFSDLIEVNTQRFYKGHDTTSSMLIFTVRDTNDPLIKIQFAGGRADDANGRLQAARVL